PRRPIPGAPAALCGRKGPGDGPRRPVRLEQGAGAGLRADRRVAQGAARGRFVGPARVRACERGAARGNSGRHDPRAPPPRPLRARRRCGPALPPSAEAGAARPFPPAGTKRVYERPRPFAIRHIALDLTLLMEDKAIACTATVEIARVDPAATEIVLDAVGFE